MIFYIDGKFVPEEEATISVLDRSFLYGDALFETIRVYDGRFFLWGDHLDRFARGAELLRIRLPEPVARLSQVAQELLALNRLRDGLLRLHLSRGIGRRGYSIRGADDSRVIMTLHPFSSPQSGLIRWNLWIASHRVPVDDPLTTIKHCNKIPQILARAEAEDEGADEALLLNTQGMVAEAASSNLFWTDGSRVFTPPATSGGLPGVTRQFVRRLGKDLGIDIDEADLSPSDLTRQKGVFLSMSSFEIVEVASVNTRPVPSSPITQKIYDAYRAVVCGS